MEELASSKIEILKWYRYKKKKEQNIKKWGNSSRPISFRKDDTKVISNPKGEEREKAAECLFKEITAEKVPNLGKELDIQVHEITSYKMTFSKTSNK